jgi:hypothetical protein
MALWAEITNPDNSKIRPTALFHQHPGMFRMKRRVAFTLGRSDKWGKLTQLGHGVNSPLSD